jgi:hypothetical protein
MNYKFLKTSQLNLHLIMIFLFISLPLKTLAQINLPSGSSNQEKMIFTPPQNSDEPSGSGKGTPNPGNTEGGGIRPIATNCPATDKPITALVYATKDFSDPNIENVENLTVDDYPTYWFYVPYTSEFEAQFVITDINLTRLYETTFLLPEKPGIISIRLDKDPTAQPLKLAQKYRWFFSVICDPKSSSANPSVEGWIRKVPSFNYQREGLSLREQALLYAKQGIWFNALTILGEQLMSNPTNPYSLVDWNDLLTSAHRENLVNEPIVKQYTPGLEIE